MTMCNICNIKEIFLNMFLIGSFSCEVETAVIYEQSIVVLGTHSGGKIQIHTLQGTIKQTLDCDGQPICLTLTKCYLTIATINGMVQLWDLSRRWVVKNTSEFHISY